MRHRFQNTTPDGPDPTITRPSDWNADHRLVWSRVTAGQVLLDSDPLLAEVTSEQTYTLPAFAEGHVFALGNSRLSTASILLKCGLANTLDGWGTDVDIRIQPGDAVLLVAATASRLQLRTPGARGPQGPAGVALSGTAVLNLPAGVGVLEHVQSFAAPGVLPSSRIVVALAGEPDSAENDPELLDVLSLWGTPGNGSITIGATFGAFASGPVTVNWSAL